MSGETSLQSARERSPDMVSVESSVRLNQVDVDNRSIQLTAYNYEELKYNDHRYSLHRK